MRVVVVLSLFSCAAAAAEQSRGLRRAHLSAESLAQASAEAASTVEITSEAQAQTEAKLQAQLQSQSESISSVESSVLSGVGVVERAASTLGSTMTALSNMYNEMWRAKDHMFKHYFGEERGSGAIAGRWFDDMELPVDSPLLFKTTKNPTAILDTTMGVIKTELFLDKAPITASNFIDLAKKHVYDGTYFHRIVPNFISQVGDPTSKDGETMKGAGGAEPYSTFPVLAGRYKGKVIRRDEHGNIPDEYGPEQISNFPGMIAMANTGTPNSGSSQFFIDMTFNRALDWFNSQRTGSHPVFAQVLDGFDDTCQNISKVDTVNEVPQKPIRLNTVTFVESM